MGYLDGATRNALNKDREIFGNLGILPKHLNGHCVGDTRCHFHFMCIIFVFSILPLVFVDVVLIGGNVASEQLEVVLSNVFSSGSFRDLSLAFLWILAFFPSRSLYVD